MRRNFTSLFSVVLTLSIVLLAYTIRAQVYCPPNIDFEQGNLNNWNFFIASNNGSAGISTLVSTAPKPNRHVLTSGTATDYYGGFPIVDPISGSYSLKLGNDSVNAQVDQAKFKISVPSSINNYSLIYRYAVVFENPSHTASDQPWFKVRVYDSATGAIINCASFTYVSQSSLPGFVTSSKSGRFGNSFVYYKPWSTASLNLTGQAGKTLYVEFTAADCALGGHMGYGYVDVSCGLFAISSTTCNATTPLTAPAGFLLYTWYNSNYTTVVGTGQSITVPTPSTTAQYHVVLTPYYGYGCADTLTTQITGSGLSVNAGPDTFVCNAGSVTLNTTATGNALPLTYSWTPSTGLSCSNCSNPAAAPATTTSYIVTITDSLGCTRKDTVNVVASPQVSVSTTASNCYGAAGGSVSATGTAGTAPYTYSWNTTPPSTSSSVTGLVAGTYVVTVTDARGCMDTGVAVVGQASPIVPAINRTVSPCSQSNNSTSITVTATGGVPGYKFALDNGPFGPNGVFSSLASGTYTIHIKDSTGCTKDTVVTVVNPSPLSISAILTPPTCNGGSNGAITIVASGGRPPYQYAFGSGSYSSQTTYTGLTAGTYSIHVRDSNNCDKHINSLTLPEPPPITVSVSKTNALCYGSSTGSITIAASGGNSGFTYAVDSGLSGSANVITGLPAGTHTITVTDSLGCVANASATITQPTGLKPSCVVTNASCNGSANGSVTISVSGGTSPYQYAIGTGGFGTTGSFSGLSAGSYILHIKDANNCTKDTTISIAQPGQLVLSYSVVQPLCSAPGSVTVSGAGGTAPYLYAINSGGFGSNNSFGALAPGNHVLHLKDANGCTLDSNLTIVAYPTLSIALATSNVLCNGGNTGSITVSGSGGVPTYTYAINSGAFAAGGSFNGLTAGTYAVHLKDANGCTKDSNVSITQPSILSMGYTASPILCNGNTATVTITGAGGTAPYSYALNAGAYGSSATFSNLAAGTYTLHLRDANGCTLDSNIFIAQPSALTVAATTADVLCNGGNSGTVTLTPGGGVSPYSYAVNNGTYGSSNVLSGLAAGVYTFHLKDANGCIKDTNITITEPAPLSIGYTTVQPLCNVPGSITISAAGGAAPYQYAINSAAFSTATTYSGLSAGTYTLHIKDANGCTKDSTIFLAQPPVMNVSLSVNNVLCNGGNTGYVTVNATGGVSPYTYAVGTGAFGNSNVLGGLNAGAYMIHVKDVNGCQKDTTITVTQPSALSLGYAVTNPLCSGSTNGSITINGLGGTTPYTYALNTGAFGSSNVFAGVGIGTFTLHLKDANGCTLDSTMSISQPTSLAMSLTTSPVLCNGDNTGSVLVNAAGGTAPYQYAANTNAFGTSSVLNGLTAGTHIVHLKDAHGCLLDSTINITEPTAVSLSVTTTQPLCHGASNGSINISGSGGITPYSYSLNSGSWNSSGQFSNLAAGTYVLHVRDANSCVKDSTIMIGEPAPVVFSVAISNVLCNGGGNGNITISASGGTGAYTYALGTGSFGSSNIFSGLGVGTYTIHVKDANGCVKDSNISITQPSTLGMNYTLTSPLCYGSYNGSITVSGVGGATPYTYALNSGALGSSGSFGNVGIGTYVLHIKDANGCTLDSTVVVAEPTALNMALAITDVLCHGDNSGSVAVSASGGTAPYQYAANGNAFGATSTLSGLTAGTHIVHLKDAHGCLLDTTINITEPAALYLSYTSTQPLCHGANNGGISLTGNGGVPPYSYSLNSGSWNTAGQFSNLVAGTYTLHIRDAHNCVKDSTITLGEPAAVALTVSVSNVLCNGGNTGSISINGTGGTGTYTYALDNGAYSGNNVFNGLTTGTYTVHVMDANGCVKDSNITITQPASLSISYSLTSPLCFGSFNGAIVMAGVGGTAPYTYALNNSAFGSTGSFSGIGIGGYVLHLKDANGCTLDSPVVVAEPTALNISVAVTDALCHGSNSGSATVSASGGTAPYQYAANATSFGTSNVLRGLLAGANIVHLVDAHGCTLDTTITIAEPSALALNYVATQPLCNGGGNGSVTMSGAGGVSPYTYAVNTGSFGASGSFTNIMAGTHTLHLQDANGCITDSTLNLGEPSALNISYTAVMPSCHGGNNGSISMNGSGGTGAYQYALNGGSFGGTSTFNGLAAGTYVLHLADANGCTKDSTIVLAEPAAISIASTISSVKCHGDSNGTIQIIASGGTTPYTYSWAGGTQTTSSLSGLPAGNYVATVTDANGCTLSSGAYVAQPTVLQAYVSVTAPTCYNTATGTLSASAYGGTAPYSYSWNSSPVQTTATASSLYAGFYTLTITDSNGCVYTESDSVAQTPPINLSLTSQDAKCFGNSDGWAKVAVANPVSSAYTYSWNTSPVQTTSTASGLQAGNYTVSVTSAEGCIATGQVSIVQPAQLVLKASADSVCPNVTQGTAYASATGGQGKYTYTWYTQPVQQSHIVSSLAVGTYTVVVEDSVGCTDTATATVASYKSAEVQVSPDQEVCEGSGVTLQAGGAQNYHWTPGNTLSCDNCSSPYALPTDNTTYTVVGTDAHGCYTSAEVRLTVIHHEPVSVDPRLAICEGESVRLGASGGIAYEWLAPVNPADSKRQNPIVQPRATTKYPVIITENRCFADTLTQEVQVSPRPSLELGPDLEVSVGTVVTLKATASNATKIAWSPAEELSCYDCFTPAYTVLHNASFVATVENEEGCSATDTIRVSTICDEHYLYFANVFTPNGDGQNDRFYPQGIDGFPIRTFMIYDRWGEIVFSAHDIGVNDPYAGWDGTFKGQALKPDVYVYVVDAMCSNGKKVAIRGDISLIR